MLYTKPQGMKYTEMAMYVDAHGADIAISGQHPDIEETVMRYLYCIVFMLAHKHKFFHTAQDYDHYSFYGAWHVYLGIKDKYNHQGEVVRGKTIEPIKSCLNLTKSLLYIFKANYQNEEFNAVSIASDDIDSVQFFKQNISEQYHEDNRARLMSDIQSELMAIPDALKVLIQRSPYRKDVVTSSRLYISCILTFLNQITRINSKDNMRRIAINSFRDTNIYSKVINWNLSASFTPYIWFLVNELCIVVNKEIEGSTRYYDLDDSTLTAILMSPYVEYKDQEDSREVK